MARGGRCLACDEKLGGGARFCGACGAPVGATGLDVTPTGDGIDLVTPGEPLVRERSRWLIPIGLLTVGALVAVLAFSRLDGDSSAAEPPPTTVPETTTTTVAPETTTTTTTPPPTTTVAPGFVDVSEVPDDLADTTLILFGSGSDVSALDLGTGAITPFESPFDFGGDNQIISTPLGLVVQTWPTSGSTTTVLDWDLEEVGTFGEGGSFHAVDDALWALQWDDAITLSRLGTDGITAARSLDGWVSLVGSIKGDAIVSSSWSGETHRVTADGTTELLSDALAIGGGRDWMITVECDDQLDCCGELVDFRFDRTVPVEIPPNGFSFQPTDLSWDFRRGLMVSWGREGPGQLTLFDANEMTTRALDSDVNQFFGSGSGDYSHDLTYSFRPVGNVNVIDLVTGEEILIETEDAVQEVVVAPPGWEPPGR